MDHQIDPFRFLAAVMAGWANQRQQDALEYLREANRVLREQLDGKRIRYTDDQRRRLAEKARGLGSKTLQEIATLVRPETLLAWHRKLIARKYDGNAQRGPGRPRNLTDGVDGFLRGKRYLIQDRHPLYAKQFRETLAGAGVKTIRLPARSPNLNAYAERFVRTIKESCLQRVIIFGEAGLRRVLTQYLAHYHRERNHQGLGNKLLSPTSPSSARNVVRRQRLGGLLNYYHRLAA